MSLKKFRNRIDSIDYEILRLLHERIELGLRTKRLKKGIQDKDRETQILEQLQGYANVFGFPPSGFDIPLISAGYEVFTLSYIWFLLSTYMNYMASYALLRRIGAYVGL